MSKQTIFIVVIETEHNIVDQEYKDMMAENIAIAIQNGVNGAGITPEETNTFTKKIKVREQNSTTVHERNAY
jgi:hypothetical protein